MDSYIRARTLTYTCYARVYVTWRPRSAANLAPSEKSRIWNSGESKNRARLPGYPFEATRNRNSFEASSPTTLKVTSGEKSICPDPQRERERDPLFKNVHRDVSRASIFRFRFVSRFPTRRHTFYRPRGSRMQRVRSCVRASSREREVDGEKRRKERKKKKKKRRRRRKKRRKERRKRP